REIIVNGRVVRVTQPSLEEVGRRYERGQVDKGTAVVHGIGSFFHAPKQDQEKSRNRVWAEKTVENFFNEVTAPQAQMLEGMVNEDAGKFAKGTAGTVAAAAAPLVVKEGSGALVAKFPVLGREVSELAGAGLRRMIAAAESAASRLESFFKGTTGASEP